jgi:Rrf2 family protein
MLISRTSQYAIQSLIYIAIQQQETPILSREIAERMNVPSAYLSKIMQTLTKGGLLHSFRGRLGGFSLREAPENINLMRILLITEGPNFSEDCVLGLKICGDETACPIHNQWKPIKQEIIQMLNTQTLDILREAVLVGKYRICDIPHALMPTTR